MAVVDSWRSLAARGPFAAQQSRCPPAPTLDVSRARSRVPPAAAAELNATEALVQLFQLRLEGWRKFHALDVADLLRAAPESRHRVWPL